MPKKTVKSQNATAIQVKQYLRGHRDFIHQIAWSPDGQSISAVSRDKTIRIWDRVTGEGKLLPPDDQELEIFGVAWSPNGESLASWSAGATIRCWNTKTMRLRSAVKEGDVDHFLGFDWVTYRAKSLLWSNDGQTLFLIPDARSWDARSLRENHRIKHVKKQREGEALAWTNNGHVLVSVSNDSSIRFHGSSSRELHQAFKRPDFTFRDVCAAWSSTGNMLALATSNNTVLIWDYGTDQKSILEGHTDAVVGVSFSFDARLLASKSIDNTIRLWRTDTWEMVAIINEPTYNIPCSHISFHPTLPLLAALSESYRSITILEVDIDALLVEAPIRNVVYYTNAKVVLVGESSTGKTCLARALMGEPFQPQESTHGMNVWTFQVETGERVGGGQIIRETLLWDLAGQTEYQVVHQLFLDETAVGIVVFDPTHPENPFGGVQHWEKALQRAARKKIPMILVAGRIDRGYPTVTKQDIDAFKREHGFRRFVPTSAKTQEGIERLRGLIARLVPWKRLPVTSSPELWRDIREYIFKRASGEDLLPRRSDLRMAFQFERPEVDFTEEEFNAIIAQAQAQGLLWQLSFGDFVLLKPKLLNDYASAVVRAARAHLQGLGCVIEREVLDAKINFEDMERLSDAWNERTLLHVVIETLLMREVGLREGEFLVFPSKFNRKRPEYPKATVREVIYSFSGAVENIYATLAVRLFYSGVFELKNLWKNGAEFVSPNGKLCGFTLTTLDEGRGEISIFFEEILSTESEKSMPFDDGGFEASTLSEEEKRMQEDEQIDVETRTSMEAKALFVQFIQEHLQRRAVPSSVNRERIYHCLICFWEVGDRVVVQKRIERGDKSVTCLNCDNRILLIDLMERRLARASLSQRLYEIDRQVETKKMEEVGITKANAKQEIGEFDVFLAHNSADKKDVLAISKKLKQRGLNPWIDNEQIPPGRWFQDIIQQVIPKVKAAAIFIGLKGMGKWESMELRVFISQCVERGIPVIPTLLPGVASVPEDLLFLKGLNWVQFLNTVDEQEALDNLEWGITGMHPKKERQGFPLACNPH
jgi:small GTP-binding protein